MKGKIKDVIVVVRLFIYSLCGSGEWGEDSDSTTLVRTLGLEPECKPASKYSGKLELCLWGATV